jgi:hypothetical protein
VSDLPAAQSGLQPEQSQAASESGSGGIRVGFARFVGMLGRIRRRYGTTAFIWYAIVAVFSVGYGIARLAWPHLPERRAVIVGLLAAGPLMVAFIWERLVGLKALGVEVTLAQFTAQIESTLATALSGSERQYFSGDQQIFEVIDRILKDKNIELLEINLRNDPYWWDTRLFLQAALIEDYTNIQRIVFVDDDHRYVGMAAPRQVRSSLADAAGMKLESVYEQIANGVRKGSAPKVSDVKPIVDNWSTHSFKKDGKEWNEKHVKTKLSAKPVGEMIPLLETASVECDEPFDSADVHARVLKKGTRFVPLTRGGRLLAVVNVDAFATTQILGARPPSPYQGQQEGPGVLPPNQAPPGAPQEPPPPHDNLAPPEQARKIPGQDDGPWRAPPEPWAPPYDLPPWGFWGPPPPPPSHGQLPPSSGPPPPPFFYWGHWVQPVWNSSFSQWGFWLSGFWIPLTHPELADTAH